MYTLTALERSPVYLHGWLRRYSLPIPSFLFIASISFSVVKKTDKLIKIEQAGE